MSEVNQPKTFTFTTDNEAQVATILAKYPKGKQASAILPLFDLAQRQSGGWLPRAAIIYVADYLEMPVIKAFEVASFYSMFNLEPVGKYLVQFCRTTPCWLAGGEDIAKACEKHLSIKMGQTTSDNMFTFKEVECLGACVNAPVFQINDDYYEDLTPEKAVSILKDLAAGKNPATNTPISRCGACSCSKTEEDA